MTCTLDPSDEIVVEEEVMEEDEEDEENEEEDEEEEDGSSLIIEGAPGPGDGLCTGRKEKPGESRLEQDSGVPAELIVPGCRLDIATSNLYQKRKHHKYYYNFISSIQNLMYFK